MPFEVFHQFQETDPAAAAAAYDAGMTLLRQGHFETRRLIAGVRPPILDESGVAEAISHLVLEQGREGGPKIECLSQVDFDRLVPTLENAIYRICQEALANACQHSKSKTVRVSLLQRKDRVRIVVRDWGIGFDAKAVRDNRYGLEGIRQRARLLGGKCSIRSKTGRGTLVMVELPVVERDEDE
jgi:signal transduction histidine kinase